ncbi:MAG TPA: tetratricopeptide repeat protein [Cyclobacteriaceae bacterium]|nr:tetratricopeptide repeat protein [Cyclobacteriaceae bacterium]
MILQRKIISCYFFTCICLGVLASVLEGCNRSKEQDTSSVSREETALQFTGSAACQSCHQAQYADWETSDHFRAMQEAHDSTVLGDFNNISFAADGVKSRFFKKDGKFFINTEGDDGKNHDYEVLYTFGYSPLQQYLVAFPGGRLQATRLSWDSRDKKWFHQYAGQKIYYHDWLHWTGNAQNWNTMCASCHSLDLQKNYQFASDTYSTTWKDINVGCESCHGPGSKHVRAVQTGQYSVGNGSEDSGLYYGAQTNPRVQLNTCAPCHARKSDLSQESLHTNEIMDDMIPQIIVDEFYYADGQIKSEDYEYGSFTQSKMFHKNVRCSNCHNPHSGKLRLSGNSLCMSCHEPKYNTSKHHFHVVETDGAQCVNCHMPTRTYMGNDHRRDHSFRIPRPDQSVKYGTPNACTGCHSKQTPEWAANAIQKWYGPNRTYHFSDDLIPGSLLNNKSENHLQKLVGDTLQPEIVRATAVFYLGSIQSQTSASSLLRALNDQKPLVRYHALRALENFPSPLWLQRAYSALRDTVRAVRLAAADLYHSLPDEMIPAVARGAYEAADAENKKFLLYQTDFAVGNVMLADYELRDGDEVNAIAHYIRGLKKDSLMNYARLNLSAAYNSVGKNKEALTTLRDAAAIDPGNDRIFYNLGLLYYELNDVAAAVESFQKAIRLGSTNTGLYYNYGLLLQQQGKLREAEEILLKGFALDPQAMNINYALAFFYANQNLPEKARRYAEVLRRTDPNNPEYQGLFRSLGL